jgi:hypothetical protein
MDGLTARDVSISPANVTIPGAGVSLLRTNVTLPNTSVSLNPGTGNGGGGGGGGGGGQAGQLGSDPLWLVLLIP